jgi:hypothetical protein
MSVQSIGHLWCSGRLPGTECSPTIARALVEAETKSFDDLLYEMIAIIHRSWLGSVAISEGNVFALMSEVTQR